MRRIFTSTFLVAAFAVISFNAFAQTTCNESGTGTPSNYRPVAASATITQPSGTYTEFFPVAVYPTTTPPAAIPFYLTLSAPNGNPSFSAAITIKWGAGGSSSFTCTTITGLTPSSTPSNFYFTIQPSTPLPIGTNFQISVVLTNTGNKDITLSGAGLDINAVTPAGAALPVKFQTLDARMSNNAVSLNWNVATEENVSGYEIEKSSNGSNYSKIGFVNASGQSSYSFVDSKPTAISYYRIKSVDINGRYAYSTVALVKAGQSMIVLKAFPSPFVKSLSIQHTTATGRSLISISSEDGRIIKSVVPVVGTQQTDVDLSTAKPGMYLIRFTNGNGGTETLKILKQQ